MSFFRRALPGSAWGLSALAAVFLSACATHPVKTSSATPAALGGATEAGKAMPGRNVSRVALVSTPRKSPPPAEAAPELTKTEKIIRGVRQGTLVKESQDLLVFTRLQPAKNADNSLYEDAIILARLRRQLKSIDGLPAAVPATATVRNSTAYLKLADEVSAETSARAIDSALKTDDVGAVYAQLLGAVRL